MTIGNLAWVLSLNQYIVRPGKEFWRVENFPLRLTRWKQDGQSETEKEWSKEEDELVIGNSKSLNALLNVKDKNMFRLIKQCTVAKDAWEILKTTHEGTSKVKKLRLQLLTTKFENLKMNEDENIQDY